ncbi:hypothetical protein GJ496_004324 [Pomphorhynchus laevis]|nr:hypothetical protein GJ496_004324 [Pomphorhynchus laevis]
MRIKRRYLVYDVYSMSDKSELQLCDEMPSPDDIMASILSVIKKLWGEQGLAAMGTTNTKIAYMRSGRLVLQVARSEHKRLQTALFFLKSINDRKISLRCVHLSGSFRQAKMFMYHEGCMRSV